MRCGRPVTAKSGYQLLMLDDPSTEAEDPVVCGAVRLLDHPRLQIVYCGLRCICYFFRLLIHFFPI